MKPTLSLNRTKPAPAPAGLTPHRLAEYDGQQIVLQCGVVTYKGQLKITPQWLIFTEATVTGTKRKADLTEVKVSRDIKITHVHLVSAINELEVLV